METGAVRVADLSGTFDLQSTVESGQSYCWHREDGRTYESLDAHGGSAWYATVLPARHTPTAEPEVLRVRQRDGSVEWEAGFDAADCLRALVRMDDDLEAIRAAAPDEPLVERALDAYDGMRLVRDPPFRCLVSFICSAQMRVERIHAMQRALAREFGSEIRFNGDTYHAFPTPERLAAADESELRELKLGYRAPYVQRTAEMVADGDRPEAALDVDYEDAREHLTRYVGVGEKVADCVCLFSLGFLEAVPLDTWIRTTIEEYYPDCAKDSYAETSRAIRERFGGEYAGYAQTYVFHYLRSGRE
jgi:N-glycosylase/DNA lyase